MPLSRWSTAKEIYLHDLLTPSQATACDTNPNYDANVAGIRLPLTVVLQNALTNAYTELVILSPGRF